MINPYVGLYQSVNQYDFHRAFESLRPDNFSYYGRVVLFEYLEQLAEDQGQPMELDVISLCGDYEEFDSLEEFNQQYACTTNCGPIIKLDSFEISCDCSDQHKFFIEVGPQAWMQRNNGQSTDKSDGFIVTGDY